jgi:hypothetical protein
MHIDIDASCEANSFSLHENSEKSSAPKFVGPDEFKSHIFIGAVEFRGPMTLG